MTYEDIERRIAAWAQAQPAVRAVLAIGSRARRSPDRWSDLDLLIFTTDPDTYAADPGWLTTFGDLVLTYMEPTGPGDPEWYALYEGALKLDAVLMRVEDASLDLDTLLKPYAHWDALQRGVNVLFDRLVAARAIPPIPRLAAAPPYAAEFAQVVNGFLLASVTTAKVIARGDFWRAQRWFANDLRVHLLTLIEWHAGAVEPGRDTWYAGRFIEQWADPRVLAALPQTFALYDRDSLQRSLWVMLNLFRTIGTETAERFGYEYPITGHDKVAALVEAVFSEPA